jgi:hypothetical protein
MILIMPINKFDFAVIVIISIFILFYLYLLALGMVPSIRQRGIVHWVRYDHRSYLTPAVPLPAGRLDLTIEMGIPQYAHILPSPRLTRPPPAYVRE